jgi:RimJ/RimL family protein N-acetyltransferase
MTEIPRLTTDRLILRAPALSDWPAYLRLMTSGRARFMGGPFEPMAAWGLFCSESHQWVHYGVGSWTLEARATGVALGMVGINRNPLFPEYELGWLLFEGAEGQGYAHEAAVAARAWGFGPRGLTTLVSYVDPENARSHRLAQRLGGVPDPNAPRPEPYDPDDVIYRHHPAKTA